MDADLLDDSVLKDLIDITVNPSPPAQPNLAHATAATTATTRATITQTQLVNFPVGSKSCDILNVTKCFDN